MDKRARVVMLPSNEKATFGDIILTPDTNKLLIFEHQRSTEVIQHLYIISDDVIKEGDWCIDMEEYSTERNNLEDCFIYQSVGEDQDHWNNKKIIATTNISLQYAIDKSPYPMKVYGLPQPSQSFITKFVEEYNKGNIITDVMVEYEFDNSNWDDEIGTKHGVDYKLKVSKDNTITIRKIKDSWSRDEVERLIKIALNHFCPMNNHLDEDEDKWIEQNL